MKRKAMIRLGLSMGVAVVAILGGGCDSCGVAESGPSAGAGAPARGSGAAGEDRAAYLAEADGRTFTKKLRAGLSGAAPEARRAAFLGLARLHDPTRLADLRRGLRDPDATVRRHASLGLGALEARAPKGAVEALLGALAAEQGPENQGAMLRDLGRLGGVAGLPALQDGLAAEEEAVRAGACRGLGALGLGGARVSVGVLRRVAARMVDDPELEVRRGCSYALTRLEPPAPEARDVGALVEELVRGLEDPDPEVRAMAVRALGRYVGAREEDLLRAAGDRHWVVRVQGLRALARRGADRALAKAVRGAADEALEADAPLSGPPVHVLLTGLQGLFERAEAAGPRGVAQEIWDRLSAGERRDRDAGLLHCAAARALDRAGKWPAKLRSCGFGKVEAPLREVAMAEVIGALEGAETERLGYLSRLYGGSEDARVREAALGAAAGLGGTALPLVERGLGSRDGGIMTAACDALAKMAARGVAAGPSLKEALTGAGRRLRAEGDLEGIQSWLGAVKALQEEGLLVEAKELLSHENMAVREAARAAAKALAVELAPGPIEAPENVVKASDLPAADARIEVEVDTTRGSFRIALAPREAPSTVSRFLGLVRAGFYSGLTFHRVVPGFVVQGGDPRGDGYGGPGWSQRCEDNRMRYERGTIGMALAGRDTGGSQFFITYGAEPHLEGRYTAFGRVVEGMEVVDRLQVGDRIRKMRVARGS